MKGLQRNFVKVDVLECVPKMDRENKEKQMVDKEGRAIFSVDVEEVEYNYKHNKSVNAINTYKSIKPLQAGEQVLELRVTNMGEGSGSFVNVKSFYTIIASVPKTATFADAFFKESNIPLKKKSTKENTAAMSH
ncbi:hypothetical protein HON22_05675 [Candidatus Peregrinibacteria bacterium]|jgi:hypothetical protein|nr:hypothetical protein [Candidatus Peregrinibacteria bacterium]